MIDGLAVDAQLGSQHQQAARARKLARLRHAVEAAHDPSDIFEATTDLIEAMVGSGASFCSIAPDIAAGASAGANPAGHDAGGYLHGQLHSIQQQAHQEQMLAMTLCAALSEPVLKHGEASTVSLASLSAAAGAGASPSTDWGSPTNMRQRTSPAVSTAVCAPAAAQLQLQHSLSGSHSADDVFELAPADSLTATASAFPVSRSLSAAQVDANMRRMHHPARSAHSCMLTQDVLQFRQQVQHGQALQQLPAHAGPYYQVMCQQLLDEAAMELQHPGLRQCQQHQQQQGPAFQQQQQQQQQQLLLFQQQQQQAQQGRAGRREQQQQLPDGSRKAALLDRLKRAIAVTSARNRIAQS